MLVVVMAILIMPTHIEAQENTNPFDLIDQIIEAETRFGLSGAQLAVIHKGELVHSKGYGSINNYANIKNEDGSVDFSQYKVIEESERIPVTTETLFDLASNTKMYATVYAIQNLVQEGKLTLDTKVQSIFPEFVYPGHGIDQQAEITVEDLLEHKAGFTPDPQYHNNFYDNNLGSEKGKNHLFTQDRQTTKAKVLETPLIYPRGEKHSYSDADFMLLGMIVEEITGQNLDTYVKENFYQPLGLNRITFNPLENGFSKNELVASEVHGNTRGGNIQFDNARNEVVWGEVHDEKAYYSMDDISGHAGLFGNAEDIAWLAQEMIKDKGLFTQETKDLFMKASELNDTYAVGWRIQGPQKRYAWAFSEYASEKTIGHTGWTGTLTVIDPENELVIALFTNSRNTPLMGPGLNDFFTKNFNTNAYGPISTLVYEAVGLGSNRLENELLVEMFETEIPEDFDAASISKRNAVRALMSVLEKRSLQSPELYNYVKGDTYQTTLRKLENREDFAHLGSAETYRIGHLHLEKLVTDVVNTENIYTSQTWEVFTQALQQAQAVLTDPRASQDSVTEAERTLLTAFNSLEVYEDDEVNQEPQEPQEPQDKEDTSKNETEEKQDDKPSHKTEDKQTGHLPQTGIAPSYLYSGGLLSLMGLILKKRNKR